MVPYRWPLALDLLWEGFVNAKEGHILPFLTMLIGQLPLTFERKLLGISGIDTVDPKNIESILSLQFKSKCVDIPKLTLAVLTSTGHSLIGIGG